MTFRLLLRWNVPIKTRRPALKGGLESSEGWDGAAAPHGAVFRDPCSEQTPLRLSVPMESLTPEPCQVPGDFPTKFYSSFKTQCRCHAHCSFTNCLLNTYYVPALFPELSSEQNTMHALSILKRTALSFAQTSLSVRLL